jgi:solute carrier family 25 oxoglutarate transporter 11
MVSSLVQQGRGLELYDGLSTALLRQVMYGGSRLGLFFIFEDMLNHYGENKQLEVNFGHRVLAGLGAGAVASFIGCPAEVALIRMQADRLKPLDKRANYRSVFDALMRMARSGGILTFWTGAWPTIIRAMSTYLGQLAFFSEAKHRLKRHASMSDQARTTVASGIGGPMGAVLSSPLDLVKTRLENQPHESGVVRQYHGLMDCAVKVARTEGLLGFYKGFGPYLCRMAPHS